jgi:hypothetical protein
MRCSTAIELLLLWVMPELRSAVPKNIDASSSACEYGEYPRFLDKTGGVYRALGWAEGEGKLVSAVLRDESRKSP